MRKSSKHKKQYCRESSSSDESLTHRQKRREIENPEKIHENFDETNLINFSFLDHKSELGRVLTGYTSRYQIIEDVNDFWLFINKYETLLKRSGKSILPKPIEYNDKPKNIVPIEYNKIYTTNLQINIKLDEFSTRIKQSNLRNYDDSDHRRYGSLGVGISQLKLKQFLQIVVHYLDFKQREKFGKLKKLRKSQANLPVAKFRNAIIEAVKNEQVVIIAGDTGCGKSTQVPQYLFHAGFQTVACTQPRRIACISLSKRVAHEMLCEYGTEVGYQIRFERNKSTNTRILFITEGLLLRQLSTDTSLSQYDVLVLDEVHERHLHGDFLLGITKCLLKARSDLKLVLMSATINLKLFCDYFTAENAKVIEVPGRLYPIKLHYMPQLQDVSEYSSGTKRGRTNHLSPEPYIQIMQLIDQKYPLTEKGDLLIFMSGLNEITTIQDAAREYNEIKKSWIILPLHSSLSIADQDKVFDYSPEGMRKCIISTNIAETSVTIDGIRFVVDSGKMKEMSYDSNCKMQRLKEFWISKASADQRKGRAGRTGPGVCYRLYAEKDFNELETYSAAEIHRVPLESLLLQMISMGLPNARLFPFIEPPPMESIENSILLLKQHDALTVDEKLTPLGHALSKLPVDISIGKMLLMGCVFHQLQPVLTMAAILSVQTPFTNRAYRDHECVQARKSLESDHGDPITLMNAYKEWLELKQGRFDRREGIQNTKHWCRRRGIEEQRFYEITKLRNQFQDLLNDCGLVVLAQNESTSSAERSIRHGELRQLKDLRRAHKLEGPRRRQLLKSEIYEFGDGEGHKEDDEKYDIRDVEFRLSHDSSKIQNLVSGATAVSFRDLMTLKLILVSGLYPQIAIPDEYNCLKSASQHFFHTQSKPFASLHPMGYFGNNPDILQLSESDIITKTGIYKSKCSLSAKHQLLCYLNLLETNKPYLMNTLRMPSAQTLLLFSHANDTNLTFSRIICDSWLCLDFPFPETGQTLLLRASNLRRSWNSLLEKKLHDLNVNIESKKTKLENLLSTEQLEFDLWKNLANFMSTEIFYTIKRLLPADIKGLYVGPSEDISILSPNPFGDNFTCTRNNVKGGIYITENITYGCVKETEWSLHIMEEIKSQILECSFCKNEFASLDGIQKLQHLKECEKLNQTVTKLEYNENKSKEEPVPNNIPHGSNLKKYDCLICGKSIYLSSIEILRHRKNCSVASK